MYPVEQSGVSKRKVEVGMISTIIPADINWITRCWLTWAHFTST